MPKPVIEGDLVFENYGLNGEIISRFDNVINIKTGLTTGYALTDETVVLAPYHIKLPNETFKHLYRNIQERSNIILNEDNIKYGKNKLKFSKKEIYSGKINKCSIQMKEKLAKMTEKVIKEVKIEGSIEKSILSFKHLIENFDNQKDLSILQREFYKKLSGIINKKNKIVDLLGLGIGLTPTGDDFIVGYLSILETNIIKDKLKIKEDLNIEDVFKKTTRVSALHLKGALKQRYNKKLVDLYKNIEIDNNNYIKNAKSLLNIGSSSGLDMLAGIYFGLNI